MKTCYDCGINKELNEFHKNGNNYRGRCKKCHNAKYQPATGKPNSGRFQKGHLPENPFKKGNVAWNKGKELSDEIRKKMGRPGREHSPEEIEKRRQSLLKEWGSHASYDRHTAASRRWSKEIRERDSYTCQHCGSKPKRTHAHHIVSWKDNKMLRHELSNGITLCVPCHSKTHKTFTEEHRKNISRAKKGSIPWNKKDIGTK